MKDVKTNTYIRVLITIMYNEELKVLSFPTIGDLLTEFMVHTYNLIL